jgi:hypothetical protein
VRTTIELPPGTKTADVAEIGIQCLAAERAKQLGRCEIPAVSKAFFLRPDMLPGDSFFSSRAPVQIGVGEAWTWTLSSK